MTRRPADPEEELRWMAQEVRGYVEAVLNSLAANVPKVSFCMHFRNLCLCTHLSVVSLQILYRPMILQAVVLCQVEKAKEDMLTKLYSSIRLAHFFLDSIAFLA